MLSFAHLHQLADHHRILSTILADQNIFLVGGCVRDIILDIVQDPYDIDLTAGGGPEYRLSQTQKSGLSYFHTSKFGTITLLPKISNTQGQQIKYELTPLRTEGGYQDYRHPGEINRSDDLIADSQRRDFGINCLYYYHLGENHTIDMPAQTGGGTIQDIILKYPNCIIEDVMIISDHEIISQICKQGNIHPEKIHAYSQILPYFADTSSANDKHIKHLIINPQDGLGDICRAKIKTVGQADARFQEDALRILRAIRFVNILNQKLPMQSFDIETQTYRSMKKNRYLVQRVAKERIHDELIKIFEADNPFGYVALLDDLNLLAMIFPHVYRCKNIHQPVRYHPFDIYAHTLLTLYNLQNFNQDYLVKLAMLYHDVGKVDQYHTYSLGLTQEEVREVFGTRLNHINSGVDMARKDLSALGFSNKEIDIVGRYILNHMLPGQILDAKLEQRPKKLRKLMSEVGYEQTNNLLDLCLGDRMGHYNPLQAPALDGVYELKQMLYDLYQAEGQFTLKELAIDGHIIMQQFHIQPGPHIKTLLQEAFDRVSENITERNHRDCIINHIQSKL